MRPCPQGHDDRMPSGQCRTCKRDRQRARRHGEPRPVTEYLPAAPLFEYLKQRGITVSSFGVSTDRNLHRWKSAGRIPLYSADAFITDVLKAHPNDIYGPAFYQCSTEEGE